MNERTEMLIEIVRDTIEGAIEGAVARGIAKAALKGGTGPGLRKMGEVEKENVELRGELDDLRRAAALVFENPAEHTEIRERLAGAMAEREEFGECVAALVSQARAAVKAVLRVDQHLDVEAASKIRQLERQLDGWPE